MEEKKIGILSLYYENRNYGGQLQAYALSETLSRLGYKAEQVRFKTSVVELNESPITKLTRHLKERGINGTVKHILSKIKLRSHKGRLIVADRAKKYSILKLFEDTVPHSDHIYTNVDIISSLSEYDVFISGSDQVWSWQLQTSKYAVPGLEYPQALDVYMLRFVPKGKRKISYAASIACPSIPDDLKDYYNDSIMALDAASIRESASLRLFPEEVARKISVVLDPTLLLSADDWTQSLNLGEGKIKNGYIFLYLLDCSKEDSKAVKRIAKITGLSVVTRSNTSCSLTKVYDKHLADIEDHDMGPREFVEYIKNASLVITNSFHATVFSLNFHTPFYVLRRETKVSMHSRLESVANDYNIGDRILPYNFKDEDISLAGIDWDSIDTILEEKRKESFAFLEKALS